MLKRHNSCNRPGDRFVSYTVVQLLQRCKGNKVQPTHEFIPHDILPKGKVEGRYLTPAELGREPSLDTWACKDTHKTTRPLFSRKENRKYRRDCASRAGSKSHNRWLAGWCKVLWD